MATITQENKTSSSLTTENRTAVATITQENKTTDGGIWSSTFLPWANTFYPWDWSGYGQIINQEIRN